RDGRPDVRSVLPSPRRRAARCGWPARGSRRAAAAGAGVLPRRGGDALRARRRGTVGGVCMTRERKVVTVLFADLVSFTSRAEQLDPEDVEAILRPYHERLRYELERWGGTVEKFIGDAVMALFGAAVTREDCR